MSGIINTNVNNAVIAEVMSSELKNEILTNKSTNQTLDPIAPNINESQNTDYSLSWSDIMGFMKEQNANQAKIVSKLTDLSFDLRNVEIESNTELRLNELEERMHDLASQRKAGFFGKVLGALTIVLDPLSNLIASGLEVVGVPPKIASIVAVVLILVVTVVATAGMGTAAAGASSAAKAAQTANKVVQTVQFISTLAKESTDIAKAVYQFKIDKSISKTDTLEALNKFNQGHLDSAVELLQKTLSNINNSYSQLTNIKNQYIGH